MMIQLKLGRDDPFVSIVGLMRVGQPILVQMDRNFDNHGEVYLTYGDPRDLAALQVRLQSIVNFIADELHDAGITDLTDYQREGKEPSRRNR